MCLILLAYRCHPGDELLAVANRDEFHERPTAPLAFWDDAPEVLAGRDLQAGGTWMGITRTGRFAALTNYRDPHRVKPGAPSRGHLVSDYLRGNQAACAALERLQAVADRYNSFNLLLGDDAGLYYYSNRAGEPRMLAPGLYGLSNHLLNTPWPKLRRGVAGLRRLLERQANPEPDALLDIMRDRTLAPEAELPQTGVALEWERWLSAIFIDAPGYGTRSSTALGISRHGDAWMAETTWADARRREFQFKGPVRTTLSLV